MTSQNSKCWGAEDLTPETKIFFSVFCSLNILFTRKKKENRKEFKDIFFQTSWDGFSISMKVRFGAFSPRVNDRVLWGDSLTFESVDEILWCYHSNETSSAVLSHGTICIVCFSNFRVWGWNPMVSPFKWNLFSSTFTWCYLYSMFF